MKTITILDTNEYNNVFCYLELPEESDVNKVQKAIMLYRNEDLLYDTIMDKIAQEFNGTWYFPAIEENEILYI